VIVIKASPVLNEGAEAAITPVNNKTTTAIADWRDTTVIHKETEDGVDRRPWTHGISETVLGLPS
jgi:hypothetical protein